MTVNSEVRVKGGNKMTDEERVLECQREIRRLRGVIREQYEEAVRLKQVIQCMIKGMNCEGYSADFVEKCLVLGGAELYLHEFLQDVLQEELG